MLLNVERSATWSNSSVAGMFSMLTAQLIHLRTSPGIHITDRNVCTECASCYGAFRNWLFPSLTRCQYYWMKSGVFYRRAQLTHLSRGFEVSLMSSLIEYRDAGERSISVWEKAALS